MKKLMFILVCSMLLSSVAVASPLMDFTQGKTAIDLTLYPSLDYHVTTNQGWKGTGDGIHNNYDIGITTGLGNKFALQYRQFNPKSLQVGGDSNSFTYGQELNVLYQIDKSFNVFICEQIGRYNQTFSKTETKNNLQIGLIGSTQLDNNLSLFGTIGYGKDISNYEVGLAYAVSKKVDLNVMYRDRKSTHLHYPATAIDLTSEVKGFGYGVTCKF